jgi:predicted GIY-YIG superfamily endonuclease
MDSRIWTCYILQGIGKTYVGSTNNFYRRLKQHNGLISGGAKGTRSGRPYKPICFINGRFGRKFSLQLEWRIRHPFGRKRKRCDRITGIKEVFVNNKLWHNKIKLLNNIVIIWIKKEYLNILNFYKLNYPSNVFICIF